MNCRSSRLHHTLFLVKVYTRQLYTEDVDATRSDFGGASLRHEGLMIQSMYIKLLY